MIFWHQTTAADYLFKVFLLHVDLMIFWSQLSYFGKENVRMSRVTTITISKENERTHII